MPKLLVLGELYATANHQTGTISGNFQRRVSFYLLIQSLTSGSFRMWFGTQGDLNSIKPIVKLDGFTTKEVIQILSDLGFNVTHFEPDLIEIDA